MTSKLWVLIIDTSYFTQLFMLIFMVITLNHRWNSLSFRAFAQSSIARKSSLERENSKRIIWHDKFGNSRSWWKPSSQLVMLRRTKKERKANNNYPCIEACEEECHDSSRAINQEFSSHLIFEIQIFFSNIWGKENEDFCQHSREKSLRISPVVAVIEEWK